MLKNIAKAALWTGGFMLLASGCGQGPANDSLKISSDVTFGGEVYMQISSNNALGCFIMLEEVKPE